MPEILTYKGNIIIKLSLANLIYFYETSMENYEAVISNYGYTRLENEKYQWQWMMRQKKIYDKTYLIMKEGKRSVLFCAPPYSSMVDEFKKELKPYRGVPRVDPNSFDANENLKSPIHVLGMDYTYKKNNKSYLVNIDDTHEDYIQVTVTRIAEQFHTDELIERNR